MDYKELIELLRCTVEHGDEEPWEYCTNRCGGCELCDQAADAIETLLAERDAAIEDLRKERDCSTCEFKSSYRNSTCKFAGHECMFQNCWQWHGYRKKDGV